MRTLLQELESKFVPRISDETRKDARLEASLRSMGYSGGSTKLPDDERIRRLPDAKTLMPASRMLVEAQELGSDDKQGPQAIALLEQIVQKYPQFHLAKVFLASRLIGQAKSLLKNAPTRTPALERAERLCREVLEAERDWPEEERNPHVLGAFANTLVAAGKMDEAEKAFSQAAQAQSSEPAVFADWAQLLIQQGRTQEAIEKLQIAVALYQGLFMAQNSLGELMLEQAKTLSRSSRPEDKTEEQRLQTEALKHFELSARFNPQFTPARYHAAGILMARKEFAAAAEHYAKIAAVDTEGPTGAVARYSWAVALANQEKYKQAAELLKKALQLDPQHAEARALLRICEQ